MFDYMVRFERIREQERSGWKYWELKWERQMPQVKIPFLLAALAVVRLRQGSLPGAGEEHGAAGAAVRAGQSADGGGSTGGVVRNYCATTPASGPHQASNSPVRGETQGAQCRPASLGPPFSPPSPLRQTQPRPKGLVQRIPRTLSVFGSANRRGVNTIQ